MWLARDKDGALYLHGRKPFRAFNYNDLPIFTTHYDDGAVKLSKKMFPEVTWENSPIKVESITIKLKDYVASKR